MKISISPEATIAVVIRLYQKLTSYPKIAFKAHFAYQHATPKGK